jgi:hypothetical protein
MRYLWTMLNSYMHNCSHVRLSGVPLLPNPRWTTGQISGQRYVAFGVRTHTNATSPKGKIRRTSVLIIARPIEVSSSCSFRASSTYCSVRIFLCTASMYDYPHQLLSKCKQASVFKNEVQNLFGGKKGQGN